MQYAKNEEVNPEFIERIPTPEEYNALRSAVGWTTCDPKAIEKGLKATLYCLCVFDDDRIIGMGRIVGDDSLVFYIQDIIVLPEYQGRKIGTGIMDRIMAYIETRSVNNSIIGLMSAAGRERFYEKYAFTKRPNEKMGCGMTIFVRK